VQIVGSISSIYCSIARHKNENNWFLTLREDCMLRVFEKIALRKLFRCKRDDVTGHRRR